MMISTQENIIIPTTFPSVIPSLPGFDLMVVMVVIVVEVVLVVVVSSHWASQSRLKSTFRHFSSTLWLRHRRRFEHATTHLIPSHSVSGRLITCQIVSSTTAFLSSALSHGVGSPPKTLQLSKHWQVAAGPPRHSPVSVATTPSSCAVHRAANRMAAKRRMPRVPTACDDTPCPPVAAAGGPRASTGRRQ